MPEETKFKPWNLYEDGITQSLLWQFLTCPEKVQISQIKGLTPVRISGALAFGSLVHEALDNVYSTHKLAQAGNEDYIDFPDASAEMVTAVLAKLEARDRAKYSIQLLDAHAEQALAENYGLAEITLQEYFRYWQSDFSTMQWLSLEDTFRVMFKTRRELGIDKPSIPINGKFDGNFRAGSHNRLWLFETKTKSRIDDDTLVDTLPYNLQVLLYLMAMKRIYREQPEGVLYNIIRKCQLKQGQNQTLPSFLERVRADIRSRPDFYFVRYNVSIMPDEQARWYEDFKGMLRSIINWYDGITTGDQSSHYRNSTACSGAFGKCEFLPICSRNDITSFTQKTQLFPELEAGAE